MEHADHLVVRAKEAISTRSAGSCGATQTMAFAVACSVLRDRGLAQDAAQEAYLVAFRRLGDLDEPAAFLAGSGASSSPSRSTRGGRGGITLLRLDDVPDVPVLDEAETSWTELQRQRLAGALLTLSADERRLCDRRYHGQWSTARLARDAGVDERRCANACSAFATNCGRRSRWRNNAPFGRGDARRTSRPGSWSCSPGRSSPICRRTRSASCWSRCASVYADFTEQELPEVVDLAEAEQTIGRDALYIEPHELHRVDDRRILRYDLTLPLLLTVRYDGRPLRIWTAGKAYRACQLDAMHLEAFHQAEVFCLDERARLDPWRMTGAVLQSVDALLPGRA